MEDIAKSLVWQCLTLGMKVSPRKIHTPTKTKDVSTPEYTFSPDATKSTMTARTSKKQEQ